MPRRAPVRGRHPTGGVAGWLIGELRFHAVCPSKAPYRTVAPPTPNSVVMNPAPSTRKAIARAATHDRRANSLSSPPNTSVPPATIRAISEMESATGPVSDCAIRLRGVSQGNPPPPPPANAAGAANSSSANNIALLRKRFRWIIIGSLNSDIFDRVVAGFVSGNHQYFSHLAACRQRGFLVDEYDEIDCLGNQIMLRRRRCLGNQALQPDQATQRIVGVNRCGATRMAGIPRL